VKAIMYHYVRPKPEGLPYLRYLHLSDFCRQLDFFEKEYGFVEREEFVCALQTGQVPEPGVILTFDDAIADHFDYVLPELQRRKLWGIFYIPTGVYSSGRLLDVHQLHLLLGTFGGVEIMNSINNYITTEMLNQNYVEDFFKLPSENQDDDTNASQVKLILNKFIQNNYRDEILEYLVGKYYDGVRSTGKEFYITSEQIKLLQKNGMIVGSHAVSHRVFSKLDIHEQEQEIRESFDYLDEVTGGLDIRTFCYPYGDKGSFNAESERLLEEAGCSFSFKVEPRNITEDDLLISRQALPRFDCNNFMFGKAS